MKKNFIIDNAIAVKVNEQYYDIHNFYDFINLTINPSESLISFLFHYTKEKTFVTNIPKEIQITFKDVIYFEISKGFIAQKHNTIEEIGYKESKNKNIDWLMSEEEATTDNHLIFRFDNDEFIRIYSRLAQCTNITNYYRGN